MYYRLTIGIFTLLNTSESSVADYQAGITRRIYIIVYYMCISATGIIVTIHESIITLR